MRPAIIALIVVLVVVVFTAASSMFIVNQREQAIVFQFGDPLKQNRDPGLYFKTPFVQNVVKYDKRILSLDPNPEEVLLADQKRIVVDAFVRYRITEPLRFYQAVRTVPQATEIIGKPVNASIRAVVAKLELPDLLSEQRADAMSRIMVDVRQVARNFGVDVVDVRIVRTDLPPQISENVFSRMRSERNREANRLRAEGEERRKEIIAQADRQATVIKAQANRKAEVLRGEGDAKRIDVLADAHGLDPEFFAFHRSLEAYRTALGAAEEGRRTAAEGGEGQQAQGQEGSVPTLLLSPKSKFFEYFNDTSPSR